MSEVEPNIWTTKARLLAGILGVHCSIPHEFAPRFLEECEVVMREKGYSRVHQSDVLEAYKRLTKV